MGATGATVSRTRAVAAVGLFTALYVIGAGIVGSLLGPVVQGYPEHLIRGILMVALVIRTRKMWSATLMGLVSGAVFSLVVPAPAPYLFASTFVSGLVLDLVLAAGTSYSSAVLSRWRILAAVSISGIAESVVALSFFTFVGTFGGAVPVLAVTWVTDILLNVVLSSIGAYIAIRFLSGPKLREESKVAGQSANPESN